MSDGEKWLSLKQAHARLAELNVDIQTIRAWGDKGWFGEVKRTMGGHRRYRSAAVDEALRRWHAGEPLGPSAEVTEPEPPTTGG